jgi:2-amino-4-hydroxy-6-hydroxymethyldihydropteridine diphosphokinase
MDHHRAAIALGSNLPSAWGDRAANLGEALRRLHALGTVLAVSPFVETEPVGFLQQPSFLNAAALLATTLPPVDLLREMLGIERAMGRDRAGVRAKGPRLIDLDLLLYDALVLQSAELTLPHPEMHRRRFVLEPLAAIAPAWIHPLLGRTVGQMFEALDANASPQ